MFSNFYEQGVNYLLCKVGFLPPYLINSDTHVIEKNMTKRIYYSSFSTKLVTTENGLVSEFSEEYQYNCSDDCFMNLFNQTYGCIPVRNISILINLVKYIYYFKYRFCDSNSESNYTKNYIIININKCLFNCLSRSELKFFEKTTESIKSVTYVTIVEFSFLIYKNLNRNGKKQKHGFY